MSNVPKKVVWSFRPVLYVFEMRKRQRRCLSEVEVGDGEGGSVCACII